MTTNRWINPVNNNLLRDDENNILTGGSLEIYEAGTSTPLTVYSDAAQTTPLGSTLTADAFGLIPDFHVPAGTQFKAIAKNSSAATMWTRDYLFGSDASTDTRLDSLESTVNGLSITRNAILNGGMRVSTGPDLTLTTSFLATPISRLYGRVTNVTAGTVTQASSADYKSGKYASFASVSTSATGAVEAQIRIPSGEAARFVNAAAVFSCLVRHDVGSNTNYTITVKKPSATADDFSSLTTIDTSSASSVVTDTDTRIEFAIANMGDCSKGIAIEVSAAVATITTKNFRISEAQLETGASRTSYVQQIGPEVERSSLVPGTVIQTARSESDLSPGYVLVTGVIPANNTIPQNTEGDELLTVSITPKYSNSKMRIRAYVPAYLATAGSIGWAIAIFKNSDADSIAGTRGFDAQGADNLYVEYEETISSTAAITYKLRCGECPSTADDLYVGSYYPSARLWGGINRYWISVEEIYQG